MKSKVTDGMVAEEWRKLARSDARGFPQTREQVNALAKRLDIKNRKSVLPDYVLDNFRKVLRRDLKKSPVKTPIMKTDPSIPKIGAWMLVNIGAKRNDHQMWIVQCVCGKVKEVRESDLKRGHTLGCGCAQSKQLKIK